MVTLPGIGILLLPRNFKPGTPITSTLRVLCDAVLFTKTNKRNIRLTMGKDLDKLCRKTD